MNPAPQTLERLQFLARVIERERAHLHATDQRLFEQPFTVERGEALADNPEEAERVEAFVGRFGRLQDTLGDKLLPVFLEALGEVPGPAVDNLDLAKRWGLLPSVAMV